MGCYLTLVSVTKDEDSYLEDFVKYHKAVGVERFVFLDREYNRVHNIFKNDPTVEVHHFPEPGSHTQAWMHGIILTQHKSFWTACIDADQALVPAGEFEHKQCDDVKKILEHYHGYAALQMNWHTFGSSGLENREAGSIYERFTMRATGNNPVNNHTQTIVQPLFVQLRPWDDPHHPPLIPPTISVNENMVRIMGPFAIPPSQKKLWCAHYFTKSRDEWRIKNSKGRADIPGQKMPFTDFDKYNTFCNEVKETRVLELWQNYCS